MYITTIAGGSGDTYQDVQGRTLILTGNDRLWSGRQVWTDGHYIFSFAQQSDTPPNKPVISEDYLIFPYLVGGGQYNFFTKDFLIRELAKGYGDGIFVAGRTDSYLIADSVIYDFGNGGKFSSGQEKDSIWDACVDADGKLIRLVSKTETNKFQALVYKNNDLAKTYDLQAKDHGWITWQFAKVRPDCSFYGIFWTYESPDINWTETQQSTNGIYGHNEANYEFVGMVPGTSIPQYYVTYTESISSTTAQMYHYEADAQIYKEIAFYYDSKQGRKDVWVQTTTGGNIQSENYGKDEDGTRLDSYYFNPESNTFSPQAGFREVLPQSCPAGYYTEVPTNTGIPIVTGNKPSSPYYYNGKFQDDIAYIDYCLSNNVTITSLVVYVGEPVRHPKTVNTVSLPFDFPTSDNNATEPMHCHVNSYFNADWNCLGLSSKNSGDFVRDALKIGGKTYLKTKYSSLRDGETGKTVVEMDSNNFRIKATGMGEILHKNISKIK